MKIKLFEGWDRKKLQGDINEFIQDKRVVDIKIGVSDHNKYIIVMYEKLGGIGK